MEYIQQEVLPPEIPENAQFAYYSEPTFAEGNNNLLASALRPKLGLQEALTGFKLGNVKLPSAEADDAIRMHSVRALAHDYFVPVEEALDLYNKIDCAIKDGYLNRLKDGEQYQQQLQTLSMAINKNSNGYLLEDNRASRNNSFILFGDTGSGKQMALDRCLRFYPQVIWHPKTDVCQVVYLRVDLAGIETPMEYCILFLQALEQAIGKVIFKKDVAVPNNEVAALLKLKSLVQTYQVGIIVIESFESLATWSSAKRERVLKHFLSLGKSVPILYSGTPDGLESLVLEMPWMNSALSMGSIRWDPLGRYHDEDEHALRWSLFTKRLWKQQCLKAGHNELTQDLLDEWYAASQGVIKLAMNFFCLCQLEAIQSGEEQITVELMKRVKKKEFLPLEIALSAYATDNAMMLGVLKGAANTGSPRVGNNQIEKKAIAPPSKKRSRKNKPKTEDSEFQMPRGFKKLPKKDWGSLPENDMRYIFARSNGATFYEDLKAKGMVLTMEDLMGDGQFSSAIYR